MSDKPYIIRTQIFKPSGKFYSSHIDMLKLHHQKLYGWDLADLIKANDCSVRDYSGMSGGYGGEFYYVVEVTYPDEVTNFCYFHMKGPLIND